MYVHIYPCTYYTEWTCATYVCTYVRIIPSGRVLCMHTLMYYTKWKRAMYVCTYVY